MPVLYDYFGFSLTAPLGSVPEIPAESCREIKMSEGKAAISSKYWLDPNRSGKAALLYCDMEMEGVCSKLVWCIKIVCSCLLMIAFHLRVPLIETLSITTFCSDIDECVSGTHECDVNAQCINTVGSYNCTCKNGYSGDGRSCSGIKVAQLHVQL